MRIHKRGIVSPYFEQIKDGKKKFEIRQEAQGAEFWVGDELILIHATTGEKIHCKITYRYAGDIGLQKGYVILGIEVLHGKEENKKEAVDNQGTPPHLGSTYVMVREQSRI